MTIASEGSRASDAAAPLGQAGLALRKAEWQRVLFANRPPRLSLLRLRAEWPLRPFTLRVHRNHSFEFVASVMAPFLAYADLRAELYLSDYDDSLTLGVHDAADIELVWLDFDRYREQFDPETLLEWIRSRLLALRTVSPAPILIANWAAQDDVAARFNTELSACAAELTAVYVADQAAISQSLGSAYFDTRSAKLSGTRLSDVAAILTARHFGGNWLPALVAPPLKGIAVDLDDTLYNGVLAEDGAEGVRLTDSHVALQRRLLELRDAGLFLAIVSRNEPEDVERLFAQRTDFPLRYEFASAVAISWDSKAAGCTKVAETLRVGADALLFVDDNPGELAVVAAESGVVRTLHAADAATTVRALEAYPGLWRWAVTDADRVRVTDLALAQKRAALDDVATDPIAYLRSLAVNLTITLDARVDQSRLHELSTKTNQFNLALARLSATEVADRLRGEQHRVASIRLADRLSDSGLIGALFARREDDTLIVDELCVSCRALGRRLEDIMIVEALRTILDDLPASSVMFRWATGARNAPAREWLARFAGSDLRGETGNVLLPRGELEKRPVGDELPVTILRTDARGL